MTQTLENLIKAWDGQAVVSHFDAPTGTWIFIAIHDLTLGMGCGGCRMKVYPSPADGLRDGMRLAKGMTHKWAAVDMDFGGGKTVLAVPHMLEGAEREGLFRRLGGVLNALNGSYGTGQDLGTTPEDFTILAEETKWVFVGDASRDFNVDPGPYTALGVFACIRTVANKLFGTDDLTKRSILIQGVGGVGRPLATMLKEANATVILSDIDDQKVGAIAEEIGATVVSNELVPDTECDILAPCALGATLNSETIPRLRCKAVAGSANNQLETPEDADRLHERGILYAPDYVVNAGGAIAFGMMHRGQTAEDDIRNRIIGVATSLDEILDFGQQHGESPVYGANRKVEDVLRRHREANAGV
jgi:leucine dehydrogenase